MLNVEEQVQDWISEPRTSPIYWHWFLHQEDYTLPHRPILHSDKHFLYNFIIFISMSLNSIKFGSNATTAKRNTSSVFYAITAQFHINKVNMQNKNGLSYCLYFCRLQYWLLASFITRIFGKTTKQHGNMICFCDKMVTYFLVILFQLCKGWKIMKVGNKTRCVIQQNINKRKNHGNVWRKFFSVTKHFF